MYCHLPIPREVLVGIRLIENRITHYLPINYYIVIRNLNNHGQNYFIKHQLFRQFS